MISIFLLVVIYVAFVSLGLPDALLGASWPQMREAWGLSLETAGYVSVLVVAFTAWSGILSGWIIRKLGTGKVVMLSGFLTGLSIVGISYAPSFYWLIVLSCGLGFGAGSVDTALNHYVALHYKAHHMNWLHCFWGLGASMGPLFISHAFANDRSWREGYLQVGMIQVILAVLFLITLPLWTLHLKSLNLQSEKTESQDSLKQEAEALTHEKGLFRYIRIQGVWRALLAFFLYSGAEGGAGLWGSSYLVIAKGVSVEIAALLVAIYFAGITSGRGISGFLAMGLNNRQLILVGVTVSALASVCIFFGSGTIAQSVAFFFFGFGLAPLFPAMIHETPVRFGKNQSQDIIGYEIAAAYVGFAILPPSLGWLMKSVSVHLFPFFVVMCVCTLVVVNPFLSLSKRRCELD